MGPDQVEAVGLAAQDGTTRVQHSSDIRHKQHRDLHHQVRELEHWELEQGLHFEVVHMIAGYSAHNDHCTDHHDSLLLTGDSSPPDKEVSKVARQGREQ